MISIYLLLDLLDIFTQTLLTLMADAGMCVQDCWLLEMKIDVFLVSFLHPESYFIVVEIHFKS